MQRLPAVERDQIKSTVPPFRAGDTVRVHIKVAEGGRDRLRLWAQSYTTGLAACPAGQGEPASVPACN